MNYKIGYLFDVSCPEIGFKRKPNKLLTLNNGHLSFRLIDSDLFLEGEKISSCWYQEPVLYEENDGVISNVVLLKNVPINTNNKSGYELICPYYAISNSSNPWLNGGTVAEFVAKYHFSNHPVTYFDTLITYDGVSLINTNEGYNGTPADPVYWSKDRVKQKEYIFYCYVLALHVLKRVQHCTLLSSIEIMPIVKSIIKFVDSINLNTILSTLTVTINDNYHHKAGGDDTYYVFKTISVNNSLANSDIYLRKVINIGNTELHYERGLGLINTTVFKTGPITGEELEKERKRIINSYSREEHISVLVAEAVLQERILYEMSKFHIKRIQLIDNLLNEKYHINKVSGGSLNYFVFRHCKGMSEEEMINTVNNHISLLTRCSLSDNETSPPPFIEFPYYVNPISLRDFSTSSTK